MTEELVSISEAARRLQVPRTLLGRRIREHGIPAFANPRDHHVALIRLADLESLRPDQPLQRKELKALAVAS